MAAVGKSLKTIELKCEQCKGQCWDSNQSQRQAKARKFFKGASIPNSCVDSEIDGPKCPFQH